MPNIPHQLQQKLPKLTELELTQEVIIPLFRAIGFHSVDYHGGPFEKGRDLICWRTDELGTEELAVVQIKRFKLSASSSNKASFTEVVNQLQQAIETPVPAATGLIHAPSLLYFITPYQLETRALESRFNKYQALRAHRVKIIDGVLLSILCERHIPSIVQKLLGPSSIIAATSVSNLSNRDLLHALNRVAAPDISQIYCDLGYGLGGLTSRLFFTPSEDPDSETVDLESPSSRSLLAAAEYAESTCNFYPLGRAVSEIQDELSKANKKRETQKASLASLEAALARNLEGLSALERTIDSDLRRLHDIKEQQIVLVIALLSRLDRFGQSVKRQEYERRDVTGILRKYSADSGFLAVHRSHLDRLAAGAPTTLTELNAEIETAQRNMLKLHRCTDRLANFALAIGNPSGPNRRGKSPPDLPSPLRAVRLVRVGYLRYLKYDKSITAPCIPVAYREIFDRTAPILQRIRKLHSMRHGSVTTRLDGRKLRQEFSAARKLIEDELSLLKEPQRAPGAVAVFVDKAASLLFTWDKLLAIGQVARAMGMGASQQARIGPPDVSVILPIHEVLNSTRSSILLGPAGSGKTTTLQMYTRSRLSGASEDVFALYAPLAHVVLQLEMSQELEPKRGTSVLAMLQSGICFYLRSLSVDLPVSELTRVLDEKPFSVLVLDGIDEALGRAPWIVDAIVAMSQRFRRLQILTSSREGSQTLNELPFLALSLRPFSEEQRDHFIGQWFREKGAGLASGVLLHLKKHAELAAIVTNPLNATILCVIAEGGIPLPDREIRLYEERFRLLLGHYDASKRIRRITSSMSLLESVAEAIAYFLHSSGLRYALPDKLKDFVINKFRGTVDRDASLKALSELRDPCNILVPETDKGELGFGHLRFQEYLVAAGMRRKRVATLAGVLEKPWWRSAFVLLAQMPEEIDRFIDWFEESMGILKAQETLSAMVIARPEPEQELLRFRLDHLIDQERTALRDLGICDPEVDPKLWTRDHGE